MFNEVRRKVYKTFKRANLVIKIVMTKNYISRNFKLLEEKCLEYNE